MSDVRKRIHSQLLVGVEKDHDDHRGAAPMHGTGDLVLFGDDDETDAHNWYVEFRCDVCNQIVHSGYADLLDIVRQALKEAGIIAEAGTFK